MSIKGPKRLIDGNYAGNNKIVARCHLLAHRGWLTKDLMQSHKCIEKKCAFFEKVSPDYLQRLERAAQDKELNRALWKKSNKIKENRDAFIRETLEDSGHIHITSIRDINYGVIEICYIFDVLVNLSRERQFLSEKLGKIIKLRPVKGAKEAIEEFIRKPRRETGKVTDLRKAPKVGNVAKKRLEAMGVYCLEDLFNRSGKSLYKQDCNLSGYTVNRRFLAAYCSAVEFANAMVEHKRKKSDDRDAV